MLRKVICAVISISLILLAVSIFLDFTHSPNKHGWNLLYPIAVFIAWIPLHAQQNYNLYQKTPRFELGVF